MRRAVRVSSLSLDNIPVVAMRSVVDSAVVDSIEQAFQEVEDLLLPVDIENGEELHQGSRPAVLLFGCMFR